MNNKILMGAAVLGLTLGSQVHASDTEKPKSEVIHCKGINSCKGTGDCGGKAHSCAGQNSCKGKGWKKMTQKDYNELKESKKQKSKKKKS